MIGQWRHRSIAVRQRVNFTRDLGRDPTDIQEFSNAIYQHFAKKIGKTKIKEFSITYDLGTPFLTIYGVWSKTPKSSWVIRNTLAGLYTILTKSQYTQNDFGFKVTCDWKFEDWFKVYENYKAIKMWERNLAENEEYTVSYRNEEE